MGSTMPSENPIELYKYKALGDKGDDKGIDRVEDMLANNRIWFSEPGNFNDPFDCARAYYIGATRKEVVLRMATFLTRRRGLSVSEAIEEAEKKTPEPGVPLRNWLQSRVSRFVQSIEKSAILCLTPVRDDPLMWAHYADHHKGVCIQFRPTTKEHEGFIADAKPVLYSDLLPIVDPVRDDFEDIARKIFFAKSIHFRHEREKRIVRYDDGPGLKPLPPSIVGAVILGCRISKEHRERVRKACALYNGKVEIVTAQLAPETFGLTFSGEGTV